ncbi:hypothetical protein ACF044_04830 [Microbacterium sp. NPDC016588]
MSAPAVSAPSAGSSARELHIGFHTRVPFETDPAVAEADDLIAFLPPEFGLTESTRLLEDIAEHVLPALRAERKVRA